MAKAPKSKKHPKDMTTEEAINHVFHPKIVKHLKNEVDKLNHVPTKP
jgi:hypothetical protein